MFVQTCSKLSKRVHNVQNFQVHYFAHRIQQSIPKLWILMIVKEMSNKQDLKKLLKKTRENLLDPEKNIF